MPANLDNFKVQAGEPSNFTKFDGFVSTLQSSLEAVGDPTQNGWGAGLILAPSQLSSGGASTGDVIPGDYDGAVLADSPRGYWKLDEPSGNFADSSGNGHTATANGSITYTGTDGIILDGTSGYLSVPDHADFDLGDVFTIEASLTPTAFADFMMIVDKGAAAYRASIAPTGKFRLEKPGTGVVAASTTKIPLDDNEHHVVLTKNAGTVKLYLDSIDVTGTVTNQTFADNAITMGIGAQLDNNPAALFFKGGMRRVALYSTALSQARVLAHFQARGTLAAPQTPVWDGSKWAPTSIRNRTNLTITSTVTVSNTVAETDLFTGNAATAGSAGFTLPPLAAGSTIRFVAGGDLVTNNASSRKVTLALGVTSGGVFTPIWKDQTGTLPQTPTARAWRLRGSLAHRGANPARAAGLFALTDTSAATTGLGALRDSTHPELFSPFLTQDATISGGQRLVFAVTFEAADPALTMRTLFARVEVTT